MKTQISNAVIGVVGAVIGKHYYSHSKLETLFMEHGAPGEPPGGNCIDKCVRWLKLANLDPSVDVLELLGGVIQDFMDSDHPSLKDGQDRIHRALTKTGLSYHDGGHVLGASGTPSQSLEGIIRERRLDALEVEFQRALESVGTDPPAAVTAACAIIEAVCKVYIDDNGLSMPSKQTIKPLWAAVQQSLGLSPAVAEDADLVRIYGGLATIVEGVGSLRTHAGSAHGHGRNTYDLEPRHARLAIHAAHSLVTFVLESWPPS